MSLKTRIEQEREIVQQYGKTIEEARGHLWQEHFVATHDERRHGESDVHWHRRRKRNREAFEHRDDVVKHLVRKRDAHDTLLDKLKDHRLELKEAHHEERSTFDKGSTSIVVFDGRQCVEDLAYWLDLARKNGWLGVLISGFRTPEYSTQLCIAMCGNPTCPGRCAGATSNHSKLTYPGPAGDLTDYIRAEDVLARIGAPYFNDLPYDLPHMSRSGH